ncbi:hypothetical protein BDZ45DRAFT_178389 [Acephala macrosclerotiorum]|nr:hypothetical protein BDZ45DRAFT_178389 [Acephala macrosclerotiorum]
MTSALPDSNPDDDSELTIYPDYCHTLSPTIGKWVPLRARDVHVLKVVGAFSEQRILWHFNNHPIKWVKVTGVVVAVDEFKEKRIYTLDDSSGACVECTAIAPPDAPSTIGPHVPKHLEQLAAIEAQAAKVKQDERGKGKGNMNSVVVREEKKTPSVQDPVVPWVEVDVGTIVKIKGRVGRNWLGQMQVEIIKVEVIHGLDTEVKAWNETREFRENVLGKPWVVSKEEEERCRMTRERELRKAQKRAREEKGKGRGKDKRLMERREKERQHSGEGKDKQLVERALKRDENYSGEIKKRKDLEGFQKLDGVIKRRKEADSDILGSKNKINYPSLAVRKAAAGKYDALGI